MSTPPSARLEALRLHGAIPRHIAIIMDGNGRWARERGLVRPAGHQAGARAVREAVEGALHAGVEVLTLFAFSHENWQRPQAEIDALMALLEEYIAKEAAELRREGVTVRMLGDLDRLAPSAREAVDRIEAHTAGGARLALNICLSYGARAEIVRAARRLAERVRDGALDLNAVTEANFAAELYTAAWPDPDLLVRTSGEMRLSNFLLWQVAYAELHVTPVLWPDFGREDLYEAILDFQGRDRRFGRVTA
ncbi:MAG: polyprenyl diphosphate synthase [Gemmatimonadales bacterium]